MVPERGGTVRGDDGGDDGDASAFALLADRAPVAMLRTDAEGNVVWVNRRWREVTGSDRPLPIARDGIHSLVVAEEREAVFRRFAEASRERRALSTELTIERPDGERRYLRFKGEPLVEDDRLTGFAGALVDLTDLHAAQDELRQRQARYEAVVDSLHEAVMVHDHTSLVSANPAAQQLLGRSAEELAALASDDDTDPIYPDGRPIPWRERPSIRAVLDGTPVRDTQMGFLHPTLGRRWSLTNATPLVEDGAVVGAVVSFTDITERKQAEDALRASEARFRLLVEHAPLAYVVADLDGRIIEVNRHAAELFRAQPGDLRGQPLVSWIHGDDVPRLQGLAADLVEGRIDRYEVEHRLCLPDGEERWLSAATTLTAPDAQGQRFFLALSQDVTERRQAEEEARRLAHIVQTTSDLVGLADAATGRLLFLNEAARSALAIDGPVDQLSIGDLYGPEAMDRWADEISPALRTRGTWAGELPMRGPDGRVLQVSQTVSLERDADGRATRMAAVGKDVTERRRLESQLTHRATHDDLTGLPNRALLLDRLGQAMTGPARRRQVALLFLDLDHFKAVNDSLGHEAGDELLREVASRVAGILRPHDLVARLGGDEFVILCEGVADEQQATDLARRITGAVEGAPIVLRGTELTITASVGIALSSGSGHPEVLLRDADAAMYRAKELGRARLEVYDEGMRLRAAERTALAEDLARALEGDELVVHYQPTVDLATGRTRGVEALVRWHHPTRGLLPPVEFVPLAEDSGLIVGMGLRVLTLACQSARRWLDELGPDAPPVHVNLSASQVTAPSVAALVAGVLEATGLPAGQLCLEVTESGLMDDAEAAEASLADLSSVGVRLAIDDFGTGYSSLSYLRRFPVDVLKVDRSFVDGLGPDPEDSAIVQAIISLARTLDLEAVAEGVETQAQLRHLQALGCDAAQGYWFTRPVPEDQLLPMLDRRWDLAGEA